MTSNAASEDPNTQPVIAAQAGTQHIAEVLTVEVALANVARLLRDAEIETNLAMMERVENLADSWLSMAALLAQRERDAG